ncbi:hypothetical protein B0H65DRAFT_476049 [Neurospora tetraspora]|uniref:Uncharacterized protein n=1 Tax=Neurospora tetraspora TaxID=94610 RepID=A0AAE0MNP6_9PEZI|nr:hypothetical protein B0H65DRAFT_476049 [Neurospora tetraspora]
MPPIKRAPNQRDTVAQKSSLDLVADEFFELSTPPKHKRDPIPKSTLHLENWDGTRPSAHDQVARIAALAAAGNPSSTLAISGAHLSENSPPTRVLPRQYAETSTIPAYYGALYSSPSPGAVVGITLGAVAGFILILFLIYICINLGGFSTAISESGGTASVVTRRSRHHYRSSHHSEAGGGGRGGVYKHRRSSRRRSRSTSSAGDGGETMEIRRTKTTRTDHRGRSGSHGHGHGHGDGIVLEERHRSRSMGQGQHGHGQPVAERIVIDERRRSTKRQSRTARSRSPPERGPIVVETSEPSHPHERERIVVEEDVSSVSSPPGPPRRRRSSGYREIRPDEFAGGDEPLREVRRSGSISRHRE